MNTNIRQCLNKLYTYFISFLSISLLYCSWPLINRDTALQRKSSRIKQKYVHEYNTCYTRKLYNIFLLISDVTLKLKPHRSRFSLFLKSIAYYCIILYYCWNYLLNWCLQIQRHTLCIVIIIMMHSNKSRLKIVHILFSMGINVKKRIRILFVFIHKVYTRQAGNNLNKTVGHSIHSSQSIIYILDFNYQWNMIKCVRSFNVTVKGFLRI